MVWRRGPIFVAPTSIFVPPLMVAFGLLTIHTVSCHLLPMPPCFALSPKSLCVSMEGRVGPYCQVVAGERSIDWNCSIGSREEFSGGY